MIFLTQVFALRQVSDIFIFPFLLSLSLFFFFYVFQFLSYHLLVLLSSLCEQSIFDFRLEIDEDLFLIKLLLLLLKFLSLLLTFLKLFFYQGKQIIIVHFLKILRIKITNYFKSK